MTRQGCWELKDVKSEILIINSRQLLYKIEKKKIFRAITVKGIYKHKILFKMKDLFSCKINLDKCIKSLIVLDSKEK